MTSLEEQAATAFSNLDTDSLRRILNEHNISTLQDAGIALNRILLYAALANHVPTIRAYLAIVPNPEFTHELMDTIHTGSRYEGYKLLVPAGLDVNYCFGHTGGPLTEAVYAGNVAWTKFLLDAGARPNNGNIAGHDALEIAIKNSKSLELVELLVGRGARFPRKGLLPLAARAGSPEIVRYLLENGVSANESTEESWTILNKKCPVLHLAVESSSVETVRALLDHGSDLEAKDVDGKTAADVASSLEYSEIVKILGSRAAP